MMMCSGGHLLTPPKTWQASPSRRAPPHPAGSVFLLEIGPSTPLPPHRTSTLEILLSKSFPTWCLPSELQLLPRNLSQALLPPLHLASFVRRRPYQTHPAAVFTFCRILEGVKAQHLVLEW